MENPFQPYFYQRILKYSGSIDEDDKIDVPKV